MLSIGRIEYERERIKLQVNETGKGITPSPKTFLARFAFREVKAVTAAAEAATGSAI